MFTTFYHFFGFFSMDFSFRWTILRYFLQFLWIFYYSQVIFGGFNNICNNFKWRERNFNRLLNNFHSIFHNFLIHSTHFLIFKRYGIHFELFLTFLEVFIQILNNFWYIWKKLAVWFSFGETLKCINSLKNWKLLLTFLPLYLCTFINRCPSPRPPCHCDWLIALWNFLETVFFVRLRNENCVHKTHSTLHASYIASSWPW